MVVALAAGCRGGGGAPSPLDPDVAPVDGGAPTAFGSDTSWTWQLQGPLNTSYDVDVYDVDLFNIREAEIRALKAAGRTVICYFSAGTYEPDRVDAREFTTGDRGDRLAGFPDERWLDIRSPNVQRIMIERLDVAVDKGCDGVEPDNVDGYANRSGFSLTSTDQRGFNRFIANEAHARGLAVGLKNDLAQAAELAAYYDFALTEQCHEFGECARLAPFAEAGKAMFVAEYAARYVAAGPVRDAMCASSRAAGFRTLILSVELDDSLRVSCDP